MAHGRTVTHDGNGGLEIRFPFDRGLVERVKALPSRRWHATERFWRVPDTEVVALVDLLRDDGFAFDAATADLYRALGGAHAVPQAPAAALAASAPTLPGLFDDPAPAGPATAPAARTRDDLTVSALNERVRGLLESAFPAPVWLVGEIAGFNKSAHRRHVGFELVERSENGETVSKIPATLFAGARAEIEAALRRAGDPFRLEDEVGVRMRVSVGLYVPWGQYRVVVEDLDVNYTLGEAARRREEIVRRLTEAGLVDLNTALPLPEPPLRLGLITSLGSDAANDVLRTLQESGYAFDVVVHGARVQGRSTEPSVLNALDWFAARRDEFDVVLVCRGGGSRTDLVWFDSEALGRAVARFPLPVVVGIGHEQDTSVLDAVARSCKTPTAAARLLVDAVRAAEERVVTTQLGVLALARRAVDDAGARLADRAARIARGARNTVAGEAAHLASRRRRAIVGVRSALAAAGVRLARWSTLIPRGATTRLDRQRLIVAGTARSIERAAVRDRDAAGRRLAEALRRVGPAARRALSQAAERNDGRSRRLQLVDPQRVLDRGYAILRTAAGAPVTEPEQLPPGSRATARLRGGTLALESLGAARPGELQGDEDGTPR